MNQKRAHIWGVFAAGVSVVVLGLAALTWQVHRLENREDEATAQRTRDELTRRSLWRLDSQLAPLIAAEARRPYFDYRGVRASERTYERAFVPPAPGERVEASPLLLQASAEAADGRQAGTQRQGVVIDGFARPFVIVRFQVEPDGRVTSPAAPDAGDLAALIRQDPTIEIDPRAAARASAGLLKVQSLASAIRAEAGAQIASAGSAAGVRSQVLSPGQTRGDSVESLGQFSQNRGFEGRSYDADRDTALRQRVAEQVLNTPQQGDVASRRSETQAASPAPAASTSRSASRTAEPEADELDDLDDLAGLADRAPEESSEQAEEVRAQADRAQADRDRSDRAKAESARKIGAQERDLDDRDEGRDQEGAFAERTGSGEAGSGEAGSGGTGFERAESKPDAPGDTLAYADETDPGDRLGVPLVSALAAMAEGGEVQVGGLTPAWVGEANNLVLTRTVEVSGETYVQGLLIDWEALREALLESVSDLSPTAQLAPVTDQASAEAAETLALIPARFEFGGAMALPARGMTPARWGLVVTWVAVVGSAIVTWLALRASLRLADRRGRFVSAVTHELRTPLTSFRLYSQMLAGGMVKDENARREYLGTLERESSRLAEVVENVLAYARLDRGGGRSGWRNMSGRGAQDKTIEPEALLARVTPSLSRRAERDGMDLVVAADLTEARGRAVAADPASVERILMNLVENACKYGVPEGTRSSGPDAPGQSRVAAGETGSGEAASGETGSGETGSGETRIHLDVRAREDMLELLVADYGPGIAASERARVFGEFQRGRQGALADKRSAAGGLGLGLALARGLARENGGDLRLVRRRGHGAEFLLTLPLAEGAGPRGEAGLK